MRWTIVALGGWLAGWAMVLPTACDQPAHGNCPTGTAAAIWQVGGILVYATTPALLVLVPLMVVALVRYAVRCLRS